VERDSGWEHLVHAFRQVIKRWRNARLWLAGVGAGRRRLVDLVHASDLRGKAVLPGMFADAESLLAAADVFVLPSAQHELSIALLEAMAVGLPAVASNVVANRAVIRHEEHGLLVPFGHPSALAQAINRLLEDKQLAHMLASAARRRVANEFTVARCAREHLQLFSQLVAAKSAAPT
jgi:glycosyltransferase involved in cell wall biosynthesis